MSTELRITRDESKHEETVILQNLSDANKLFESFIEILQEIMHKKGYSQIDLKTCHEMYRIFCTQSFAKSAFSAISVNQLIREIPSFIEKNSEMIFRSSVVDKVQRAILKYAKIKKLVVSIDPPLKAQSEKMWDIIFTLRRRILGIPYPWKSRVTIRIRSGRQSFSELCILGTIFFRSPEKYISGDQLELVIVMAFYPRTYSYRKIPFAL